MADQSPYPYPSPTTQLEQLAGAAQQASSPPNNNAAPYSPNQRPPNPRKRKADGSSASSRGVANLTPDQLAKKRANDREAQRAIRERTRNNIEALESRIKELENQQPFQDLQSVIRSRDAVIAENEDLKRRLQNITTLSQYQPGAHGLNDLAMATAQQAPLPMPGQRQQTPTQHNFDTSFTQDEDSSSSGNQQHLHPDLRNLGSPPAPTANMQASNGTTSPRQSRDFLDSKPELQWDQVPLQSEPTNALDSAILDLVASRRVALGAEGQTNESSSLPSFAGLISSQAASDPSSLAAGILEIITQHLGSADLAKRVAFMYIMHTFLAWLVAPSQELWSKLPEWMRPVYAQLEQRHPAWIDFLPWPHRREQAITHRHPLSHFYNTISSLNLEWPYDQSLCLTKTDGEDWVMNPVFEAHVRNISHWNLRGEIPVPVSDSVAERDGRDEGLEGLLQGLGNAVNEGQD